MHKDIVIPVYYALFEYYSMNFIAELIATKLLRKGGVVGRLRTMILTRTALSGLVYMV